MIEVSIEIALIALVCSCLMFANGDLPSRAFYMSCERRAISVEARCLTDNVFYLIELFNQDGERSTKKRRQAIEAVIADLLLSHEKCEHGYCYRSRMNDSFTGEWIGREPFNWAIDRLKMAGLVDLQAGTKGVPLPGVAGQASRFFIQPKLIDLASSCGIGRGDVARHFPVAPDALAKGLVIVRAGSTKEYGHYGKKIKGRRIGAASRHKVVKETNVMLTAVNNRLHEAVITPPGTFVRLQRVFNNGDSKEFNYDSGGRNYDRAGTFQHMKKAERAFIEIDGEGVVEVDIQACHFLILRSLLKHKFDPSEDPYDVPGIDRDVVKAYMAMALGGKSLPDAWHPQARKNYEQAIVRQGNPLLEKDISKVCRAKDVKAALLIKYPFLSDWNECKYRWDSFQFEESSIMLNALYDMAIEHNIPALPLHDAVIVKRSDKERAKRAIEKAFHNRFGIIPVITLKREGEG